MEKNEKGIDIISPKKLKSENIISSQMQKKEQIRKDSKKPRNNKNTTNKNKKQNKKQNKLLKKIKKWLAALGIGVGVTTLAISAGEGQINEPGIEKPIEKPNAGKAQFKKDLKVKTNEEKAKEIEALENSEDVLSYLKNLYIEEYENKTGDTSLTTKDIEIRFEDSLNYAYKNKEKEEIILHGEHPKETEKSLEEQGIEYDVDDNLGKTIIVTKKAEDKIIDGAVKSNDYNKVLNVVEPKEKNLGIVAKDWEKYTTLCDLWKTFEDPTNNEYMEKLAKEAVIKSITNEGKNINNGESITPKQIDEGR